MMLNDDIYSKVVSLSEKGDKSFEKKDYNQALSFYQEALNLLPEEKTDWEAATWLFTAVGDANFNLHEFPEALNAYNRALQSPDGLENPYIWFSMGQVYYEQKEMTQAKDCFMRAYMLDGDAIFKGENYTYFELIKSQI